MSLKALTSSIGLHGTARFRKARDYQGFLASELQDTHEPMAATNAQPRVDVDAATSSDANRRTHLRLNAEEVLWLQGVRIKYGADVRVIDISAGGILFESSSENRTDATLVFEVTIADNMQLVPARVVRCSRVVYDSITRYQTACAFKRPLAIPGVTSNEPPKEATNAAPTKTGSSSVGIIGQKVIARFIDGRVVRGYTNDFHASKPHLHLTDDAASGTRFVPIAQLKALFFVREFGGDATRVERKEFDGKRHGRKVEVTFSDGEVLLGTTLGYTSPEHPFFVQPADAASNNLRVFVPPAATRRVRFL
jgi:hypothetical protein